MRRTLGTFTTGITKTTADGTTFGIPQQHDLRQEQHPVQTSASATGQLFASDWKTNFEASFSHPLLQGGGVQYNRIAGPMSFDQYAAGLGNPIDGVMIARIRTDQTLADFEGGVRNLMRDVEDAYWELYFAYRDLEARKMGRDSALETWKKTARAVPHRLAWAAAPTARPRPARSTSCSAARSSRRSPRCSAPKTGLRYIMGLSMSDGRLIRPSDEPTTARVAFDWSGIHCEALTRRVEVRRQKWEIKRRELELIAARNFLLPRLDAVGRYRWLGLGRRIDQPDGRSRLQFDQWLICVRRARPAASSRNGNSACSSAMPIGFRRELSGVRHHELLMARERAILQDLELEISHQLGDAIRDVDLNYGLTQTNFNRRVAAEAEVAAVNASYQASIA